MFLIILNTSKQEFEIMTALVAEDEIIIALDIAVSLRKLGYIVPSIVNTGEELLNKYYLHNPDLVITDIMLKGSIDGIEAARMIKQKKDIPILFISGFSDPNYYNEAKKISPNGLVSKPFNSSKLKDELETLFNSRPGILEF